MSNNERLMKQGLLTELRGQYRDLENRAENHLNALRAATFVVTTPLDLDGGNIVAAAQDLHLVIKQAAAVSARVETLEEELGQ